MARRSTRDTLPKLTRPQRQALYLGRKARYGALVLLVALAAFFGDRYGLFGRPEKIEGGDLQRYDGHSVLVSNTVDGDTLDVDVPDSGKRHTRIRLWGVDTPETKHPDKPVEHFGPEAFDFTRRSCLHRTVKLALVPGHTRDRYGRLLAYVMFDDSNSLNAALLKGGYAYADPRFPHPHDREYRRLQDDAMRARRGLWKNVRPQDLPHYYQGKLKIPR